MTDSERRGGMPTLSLAERGIIPGSDRLEGRLEARGGSAPDFPPYLSRRTRPNTGARSAEPLHGEPGARAWF
jgi:hypothetical protein